MRDSHVEEFIASHRSELFSELKEEIADDRITDIEWDGYNLWITHLDNGSYLSKKKLTAAFVDNLSIRLANIMMVWIICIIYIVINIIYRNFTSAKRIP